MTGPTYIAPGTSAPIGKRKKRQKRKSWAERESVHSINIPPTVPREKRSQWIENAILDLFRQISSQEKASEKRLTRRTLGKLVAGATDREIMYALKNLAVQFAIKTTGLEEFVTAGFRDNETFLYPQLVKSKGRDVQRVFFRGDLVTCYWLANLPRTCIGLPIRTYASE